MIEIPRGINMVTMQISEMKGQQVNECVELVSIRGPMLELIRSSLWGSTHSTGPYFKYLIHTTPVRNPEPGYRTVDIDGFIGVCQCGFDSRVFGIHSCHVRKDLYGAEIGRRLFYGAIHNVRGMGCKVVQIVTDRTMAFERIGFYSVCTFGKGEYLMQNDLTK